MQPIRCFRRRLFTRPALFIALALFLPLTSATAQNLFQNPGFESGATGWSPWGPVTFTSSTAQARTGTRAALLQTRTDTWNGIVQSLQGVLQPGTNYKISAWARLVNPGTQPVQLTIQKVDDSGTSYAAVANATATATGWVQLIGGYTLTVSGTLSALNFYIEGPAAGVDLYADDFDIETDDWKAAANARIEQVRKRDVRLLVVDAAGNPMPSTSIAVRQTSHQFAFGSAINNNISNPKYASFFRTNFEWAVMENESKWYYNEPTRGNVTYAVADTITNYCFTNHITLRGHNIFWAVDQDQPQWVTNLSNADLLVAVTNRITSVVNHFKGTFVHWDVNNEMLHGNFFGNRVGNWINPWMYQKARALDPTIKLFVNDYNVVTGNETDAFKQQILNLLASNAPVDCIGAQGHFGATIDPSVTESRMDSLSELGLPLWITEYDSLNADHAVLADNLETLYRLAFSKPSVGGVLMWGFWAGSHWRGSNAAIVNLNWTLNEAGQRYQSLFTEWTTVTNGVTGADGVYKFRGFHGSYDIMLTPPGGQPTLRKLTLDPGADTKVVTLIAHLTGPSPLLYSPAISGPGSFQFQLTGDAGRTYAIQNSTNLNSTNWSTLSNLFDPNGTLWFTNPSLVSPTPQFFRAKRLP